MKTVLLSIQPKSRKGSYIGEHALKTAMGLVGTFGGIFFVIFLSAGRAKNSTIFADLIVFLFRDHVEVTVGICLLAAIAFNLFAYLHNKKKIYIRHLEVNEAKTEFFFETISVYRDETQAHRVSLQDCHIREKRIKPLLTTSHKIILITDLNGTELGRIDLSFEIHGRFSKQVKQALAALNEIKPIKLDTSKPEQPYTPFPKR